jgi:hypothetical protein
VRGADGRRRRPAHPPRPARVRPGTDLIRSGR